MTRKGPNITLFCVVVEKSLFLPILVLALGSTFTLVLDDVWWGPCEVKMSPKSRHVLFIHIPPGTAISVKVDLNLSYPETKGWETMEQALGLPAWSDSIDRSSK